VQMHLRSSAVQADFPGHIDNITVKE